MTFQQKKEYTPQEKKEFRAYVHHFNKTLHFLRTKFDYAPFKDAEITRRVFNRYKRKSHEERMMIVTDHQELGDEFELAVERRTHYNKKMFRQYFEDKVETLLPTCTEYEKELLADSELVRFTCNRVVNTTDMSETMLTLTDAALVQALEHAFIFHEQQKKEEAIKEEKKKIFCENRDKLLLLSHEEFMVSVQETLDCKDCPHKKRRFCDEHWHYNSYMCRNPDTKEKWDEYLEENFPLEESNTAICAVLSCEQVDNNPVKTFMNDRLFDVHLLSNVLMSMLTF